MNITEMISILSNTNLRRLVDILICKVTKINKTDNTISVICLSSAEYEEIDGVQLNIDFDINSQIVYPELDSLVLVIYQESIGGVAFHFTSTDNYKLSVDESIFMGVENSTVDINSNELILLNETFALFQAKDALLAGGKLSFQIDSQLIGIGKEDVLTSPPDFITNCEKVIETYNILSNFLNSLKIATSTFPVLPNGIDDGMDGYKLLINVTEIDELLNVNQFGTVKISAT